MVTQCQTGPSPKPRRGAVPRARGRGTRVGAATLALALLIAGCGGLAGCAGAPSRWPADTEFAPPGTERAWERYGYYVADVRYVFRTRASLEGTSPGPLSFADLYLVVKALTPEGARIGSLAIPHWNRSVHDMEVILLDPSGRRVPVDQERVRRAYERRGALVLPRVTPGSVVAVHITLGPYAALDAWEYPLAGPAPVWRSRVEFAHPLRQRYDYTSYNGLGPPKVAERRQSRILAWSAVRVPAAGDLPFLDPSAARPRLVIAGRDADAGGFPDWRSVAARAERRDFSRTVRNRTALARALARGLAGGPGSDTARARSLLHWVQDNVGVDPAAPAEQDPDDVVESRRGSPAQLAALLEEMALSVGLEAEILLTRDRERGGLDTAFVNPEAAADPVVAFRLEGGEMAAYPQSRAYGLGDYPPGCFGLAGLSLRSGGVRPLPAPARPVAGLTEVHLLRLDTAARRRISLEVEGPYASLARGYWHQGAWADTLGWCRALLKGLGFVGTFRACAAADLGEREKPLRLEAEADEARGSVRLGGTRTWPLPGLFSRPAWFYDPERTDPYHFPYEQRRRQAAVLEEAGNRVAAVELPCAGADTSAVYVECLPISGDAKAPGLPAVPGGQVLFAREVLFRKGTFRAADLKGQHGLLLGLDAAAKVSLRDTLP